MVYGGGVTWQLTVTEHFKMHHFLFFVTANAIAASVSLYLNLGVGLALELLFASQLIVTATADSIDGDYRWLPLWFFVTHVAFLLPRMMSNSQPLMSSKMAVKKSTKKCRSKGLL